VAKTKVAIRVDGNAEIGLGHFVRCTSLAHMLKDDYDIDFHCKPLPADLINDIKKHEWGYHELTDENAFVGKTEGGMIVIMDGYKFGTDYQMEVKARGVRLVCIDDLHDREFFADLIINHAPGVKGSDYRAQAYTRFALGPQYALLRPSFLKAASREAVKESGCILVSFGGSDSKNLTLKAVEIICGFREFKRIIVITGASYNFASSIESVHVADKRVSHFHAIDEEQMAELMLRSDLTVTPSSSILFESIAAGCRPIICYYAENQKHFHDYLVKEYSFHSFNAADNFFTSLADQITNILDRGFKANTAAIRNILTHSRQNNLQMINALV
jgi:UDP-2,4-diacetamido-2,4,6-trideoxy-beta-L-altropyranose hydrolase